MISNFTYVRVKSLDEALTHLSSSRAVLHAGGTDLLGCLREHVFDPEKVVSISKLSALRGITEGIEGGLSIGALTTVAQVAESPIVGTRFKALAQGASEVASPQLRNQGTMGGNLCQKPRCWYYRGEFQCLRKGGDICFAFSGENQFHCIFGGERCYIVHPSDTAPALVALEATARVVGPKGTREVPVEGFHVLPSQDVRRETVLEPDEIVTEILIPAPAQGSRSSYRKVRARRAWDFALAGVALALQFKDDVVVKARVVLSGAAPVPWRSEEVEELITNRRLDEEIIKKASDAAVANAEPLDKNGYKIPLFRGVVEEALMAIAPR